jgi:ubiquinone/menaquinone biosynthesis C-methylase UbiE
MSAEPDKAREVAAYYNRAAGKVPAFTVLNYGFSGNDDVSRIPRAHPEFFCLRLYEHSVRETSVTGADVLEVSSGRGGGAHWIWSTFEPKSYLGIDVSEENVRMATAFAPGPTFELGRADALPVPDASFDVVVNIEASHLYPDRGRFFADVFRVLRPGGRFCYTDGCWADDDCTNDLLAAGFVLHERREITQSVIRALEQDSARREALFDAMDDESLRDEYKDWGGVVGFRAHRRFVEGQTRYFSHLLDRPKR